MNSTPVLHIPVPILDTRDLPSLHEPAPPPDRSDPCAGEKRLLLAILRRVLFDCAQPDATRAQAVAWLQSPACAEVCAWLDADVEQLRALAAEAPAVVRKRLGKYYVS
jgi:hypothetical protein